MHARSRFSMILTVLCLIGLTLSGCGGSSSGSTEVPETAVPTALPTEMSTPSPTSTPEAKSAILAVAFNGYNTVLYTIDVTAGTFNEYITFSPSDSEVQLDYSITQFNGSTPFVMRTLFSPDYSLTVASKSMPDGSRHVGWIDQYGTFTNVSALRSSGSDFSSAVLDDTPMFGHDGYFYFATRKPSNDWMKNSPTIMRTSIDDPAGIVTVPDQDDIENLDVNYFVQPDGHVEGLCPACVTFFANGLDGRGAYDVQDWIDDTSYVFIDMDGSRIYRGEAESREWWADQSGFRSKGTALIPSTTRNVWSPVVSDDGSMVAFLSSSGELTDIFILPLAAAGSGGDPVKLDLNNGGPFAQLSLLDWTLIPPLGSSG